MPLDAGYPADLIPLKQLVTVLWIALTVAVIFAFYKWRQDNDWPWTGLAEDTWLFLLLD